MSDVLKGWRIGDYLRQFSIVAAGVIVTFWGSDLISTHSREKEIRSVMQLIRQELANNYEELKHTRSMIEADIRMSRMLKEANMELEAIPADTIEKYWEFFSSSAALNVDTDALEVLKGSQLMQHINDKQMLQDLLQTYGYIERMRKDISDYYNLKNNAIMRCIESLDKQSIKKYMFNNTSVYKGFYAFQMEQGFYAFQMEHPVFLSFVSTVEGYCDWNRFNRIDSLLNKEINLLQERFD